MRTLATLAVTCLLLATVVACGDDKSKSGPIASEDIDRDAWRDALVATGEVRADPDLDALEKVTRDQCNDDVDELALGLTLVGAQPNVVRINMKYVCPNKAGNVDKALKSIQGATSNVDEACDTPPNLRTEEQSQLAEAMGC
jgi:hypothetical protein